MELEILTMCDECKAVQISEKPEIWMRYNFFTAKLYCAFTDKRKGLIYSSCPRCSNRLRVKV